MTCLQICKELLLNVDCNVSGIGWDGNYFYIVGYKNVILKVDVQANVVEKIRTQRQYNKIAYDSYYSCFWAISGESVYKLNLCFEQEAVLDLCELRRFGNIIGISCTRNNTLLLTYCGVVVEVSKKCNCAVEIVNDKGNFADCIETELGYIMSNNEGMVYGYGVCGDFQFKTVVEYGIICISNTLQNCGESVFILCKDCRGNIYILYCDYCRKDIECGCSCCNKDIECGCSCCNKDIECGCSYCNNNIVNNDIIQSIALEQTALAHILNAEGEKIQRAVASSCSIELLLEVNKSVRETICSITKLEAVLLEKLIAAK